MLKYIHSTMFGGKTLHLINAFEIYKRKGLNPIILKKDTDTREPHDENGWGLIASRFAKEKKVPALYFSDLKETLTKIANTNNVILVDEAQFLSSEEVLLLKHMSYMGSKKVLAYGLKTDLNGNLFEGSSALLSHADEVEEIPYLCQEPHCMEKANYHARYIDGVRDTDPNPVKIEQGNVTYRALCYRHWKSIGD